MVLKTNCYLCGKECYGKLCSECFAKNKYPLSRRASNRRYQHNNNRRS